MRARRSHAALWVVLAAVAAGMPVTEAKPSIEDLEVRRDGQTVQVSFHVAGAVSESVVERIHAGIPVTFRHRIEVVARRSVPLWPARVLAHAEVETTVRYDTLNRHYELERRTESHARRSVDPPVVERERRSGGSLEDARAWLTELDAVPVLRLPAGTEAQRLRLRVETVLGRRYLLYFLPARWLVSAETRMDP